MILAQEEYLAQLSSRERRSLVREALTTYAEKQRHGDVYGVLGYMTTAFVMARVM
ncbi:hypothetical protein H9L05_22685 (plasmid) [Hymenobacter qilianensis]|nr:hypothetical protein [Hymenobacter qilianensis]QNP54520.1 hypothetical protein H9L05_22685 [Hymenobacter qilianensis]